jgi:hypothetical protein
MTEQRMNHAEQVLAAEILRRATRKTEAARVLSSLPPVGVRVWELPVAYAVAAIASVACYAAGQSVFVCVAVAIGLIGAAMGVAASAETRRIAKRLAAVEVLVADQMDAA